MTNNLLQLFHSVPLSRLLWLVFAAALAIFTVISLTLLYHWRMYGMSNKKIAAAEALYISVSGLIIIMAITALAFH